ncbi:hypothetical protein AAFN90_06325 [Erwiniaceae bacterium CAU 1747]
MNFKKTVLTASLFAAIASSGMANASKSQLTVKLEGTILPASCEIAQGGNATTLSLGKISASKLNDNSETHLPEVTTKIDIICPAQTAISIQPTDVAEKAGQVVFMGMVQPAMFSLGATSDGRVIGGYFVKLQSSSKVDGHAVKKFISAPMGSTVWSDASQEPLDASGKKMYSWSEAADSSPALGKTHSIDLKFSPFISPASTLNTAETIQLRGEATYDLVYL